MSQMPDINQEVNQTEDDRRKKAGAGFFARFLGGGQGIGGAAGAGEAGLGAAGAEAGGMAAQEAGFLESLMDSVFGGGGLSGMMATKAGMLSLALLGTAVAGGIGAAGYKMFGPSDGDKASNLSLFAPKPKSGDSSATAPVAPDGSSSSLDYLSQAAAKEKAADKAADDAAAKAAADEIAAQEAKDKALRDAAAAAAAKANVAAGRPTGPINPGGNYIPFNRPSLGGSSSGIGKFFGGGSSGGASAGVSGPAGNASGTGPAGRAGSISSLTARPGARLGSSAGRAALANGRGADARRQVGEVLRDQRAATNSAGAGRTYDGAPSGIAGPQAGGVSTGGDGLGNSGAPNPTSIPNPTNTTNPGPNTQTPDPCANNACKGSANDSAFDKTLMQLDLMLAGAMALLAIAAKLPPGIFGFARYPIAVAVMTIGGMMVRIASGVSNVQPLPAKLAIAAGIGVIAMGAWAMFANANGKGDPKMAKDGDKFVTDDKGNPMFETKGGGAPTSNASNPNVVRGAGNPLAGGGPLGISPAILIGGGLIFATTLAAHMTWKLPAKATASGQAVSSSSGNAGQ